jgi:hypothetical protein
MELPRTEHGCFQNEGGYLSLLKSYYFPIFSFSKLLFLTTLLNFCVCGCLIILRYSLTSLPGRILPLYVVEGSKGASHGGELLSAPRKLYVLLTYNLMDWKTQHSYPETHIFRLALFRNIITNDEIGTR